MLKPSGRAPWHPASEVQVPGLLGSAACDLGPFAIYLQLHWPRLLQRPSALSGGGFPVEKIKTPLF